MVILSLAWLGNFPALSYAKRRFNASEQALPVRELYRFYERQAQNTVQIGDVETALTDFQIQLWNQLNKHNTIGVSAPTSAGKSYILQSYAESLLASNRADNIAFIVPTRALINQVADDIARWLGSFESDIELVTTPIPQETKPPQRAIYVVTQERLQLIQAIHEQVKFEMILVDEAQSIGEGPRGVLLSSVIEESLYRNPSMQLIFAGPNIKEPGRMSQVFGREAVSVSTDEATVLQNIIFVDTDDNVPTRALVSLRSDQNKFRLGIINVDQPLLDHKSKLINLALHMGRGGQNLVYAMGPSECEDIAFGISDVDEADASELINLSDFVKDAVHPKYKLAQTVLKRVGFHYGRLPSLVRKAIEEAFSEGELRYLVTTSTLLYGVNMPAQNLFLHNPQKGQHQPISPIDFWNLAGRAGRLGKEFSGNVFLIDYGEWGNDPLEGEKERAVIPTIERHVHDETQLLINYINNPDIVPDRNKPDEYENTFVKLVRDALSERLDQTLDRLGLESSDPHRAELERSIRLSVENSDINKETLKLSPTVSIHRQQSLYDRLSTSLKKKGPSYIIPRHPLDSRAYQSYAACLKRCHDEILKYSRSDGSNKYFAVIARRWMRGEPLPQIIDTSYDFKVRSGNTPNIASVIRSTLTEVENDLRFKYVRLFSCYNAVLSDVLKDNDLEDLVSSIPPIPLYLELGACSTTMISLMGVGLSRYTSGKVNGLTRRADMSATEVKDWLRSRDIEALDLPNALYAKSEGLCLLRRLF